MRIHYSIFFLLLLPISCQQPSYDVVIRNGLLYDGSGADPVKGDLAIGGDRILAIGEIGATGKREIDAEGRAVSPGFINMLSWATESLIADGRAMSDTMQGVTLEVFGEGFSMGPLNQSMKENLEQRQEDIKYSISWTSLDEYLRFLEQKGVSPNIASFVGATTIRMHELGEEDRAATAAELRKMRGLVRQAMEEGALGLGSSLIYAPAFYASTEELIELAKEASLHQGMYISHIRSEGNQLLEALDEFLKIAKIADIRAEIYHLKAAGKENWQKLDEAIRRVEEARASGLRITADMYTYPAGSTGLDAAMPPWVQEGGLDAWIDRLQDPRMRNRVIEEMTTPTTEWENLFLAAESPEDILLVSFKNPKLRNLTGLSLAEVAERRGKSPAETAIDLVIEDSSRVGTVYFLMSEDNVRKKVTLPWISFGSDGSSPAAEGFFLESNLHPRAYGNFARLLGKYVREETALALQEAIRRLTGLPAETLGIQDRGFLKEGYLADIVVFDPETISDRATFEDPHQYAVGVSDLLVNGVPVILKGSHTGATPGRVVRGSGWTGRRSRP